LKLLLHDEQRAAFRIQAALKLVNPNRPSKVDAAAVDKYFQAMVRGGLNRSFTNNSPRW